MATRRLYFDDAYCTRFTAAITARRMTPEGQQVALNGTAFYPEGGGQPADTGTLNGIPVLDVQDASGTIWHTLAAPLHETNVAGVIDWSRRFDHMQQHHGQHLLSAAFATLYGFQTTAFHLGSDVVTIDLATPTLTAQQATAAEHLVNTVIAANRPVLTRLVRPKQLARIPLRKPPTVTGMVRVVSVEGFDYSACGGTHPSRTGGVGVLHIRKWERRGEETRVTFLCGGRAIRDYRQRDALLSQVASSLSVGIDDVGAAIERVRDAEQQARRALAAAQQQILSFEADRLVAQAERTGDVPLVVVSFRDRPIEDVRALARLLAERGAVALLGLQHERGQLLFASGAGGQIHCGTLLRTVVAAHGGRGGGQPALAEGGIPDPAAIPAALEQAKSQALASL